MYTLYPLKPISHEPDEFLLSYKWSTFDNREWRPCVEHFLAEITKRGHEIILVSSPPCTLGEDFVEIVYLIDGSRTTFTSDHLLSLIIITPEDSRVLRTVWEPIGNKMGWVSHASSTPLFGRDQSMFAGESPSWWRSMSWRGWGLLFLAVFATVSFILGAVTGQTLFLPSYAAKSGPAEVSWAGSPVLFLLAMVGNLAIGTGIWIAYFWWLGGRRRHTMSSVLPGSTPIIRGSKYDPKTKTRENVGGDDV